MSDYLHGIYGKIGPALMPPSNTSVRGIQAVIGTAPVHLLGDPAKAVMTPVLLGSLSDVYAKLGYSADTDKYTIMQAVHSTFEVFDVGPIIAVNVLDPTKHTAEKTSDGELTAGSYTLPDAGVLLGTLAVKDSTGATTYVKGTDYTAAFDLNGKAVVTRIAGGAIASATAAVKTSYNILDTSLVTQTDILAGIALIDRIFQATDTVPEILIAPGWSQDAAVGQALITASREISTVFKATALCDIDSASAKTVADAVAAKTTNGFNVRDCVPCWPKVTTTGGKTVWASAHAAALFQFIDSLHDGAPLVSPSNKKYKILGAVLADGTPVNMKLSEANQLDAEGIFTALNFKGWRSWGNNTGAYSHAAEDAGTAYDPQDKFLNVKRAFDWQSNGFILRYWENVDDPASFKAIQTVVTDENAFYNPFIGAGLVAGMSIDVPAAANPVSQLAQGVVVTKQSLTPYPPMQAIVNTVQYDVSMLKTALGGASE